MLKVLIADDHDVVRKGLKLMISEEFPQAIIHEAIDGLAMLKLIRLDEYNIVISDISMPGRNGIDFLKQLKDEFPKLPVLILSMHPEDQYALRSLKAGASGYMTKNTVSDELIPAIKQLLNGKKYISGTVAQKLAENVHIKIKQEPHEILSDREFDVLKRIATGKTISQIAFDLSLSIPTISTYRARIMEKMGMKTNAELTNYAIRNQIV